MQGTLGYGRPVEGGASVARWGHPVPGRAHLASTAHSGTVELRMVYTKER
ncbi:hypothetical protein SUDANB146_06486 [Streptomyces sp. enrichment culture]